MTLTAMAVSFAFPWRRPRYTPRARVLQGLQENRYEYERIHPGTWSRSRGGLDIDARRRRNDLIYNLDYSREALYQCVPHWHARHGPRPCRRGHPVVPRRRLSRAARQKCQTTGHCVLEGNALAFNDCQYVAIAVSSINAPITLKMRQG